MAARRMLAVLPVFIMLLVRLWHRRIGHHLVHMMRTHMRMHMRMHRRVRMLVSVTAR
ncbi:hypothetical protein GAU_2935 [Gemmatimonas aurantiaca T-27]|uniref:Uncharacterized protein n=1 Tax=Gemmatimonas aurantiaca (strain DSM 14586 / JCM 11422 / NBRC 100505 / T-27) TaxID=379066 RepID=C1ABV0_GEMAT|nr:hypothetical protein [Gemmatimonas aurantiaca]BAH39977.1 hypothetical protein GAU_2935 [Gemmatimonas aurantiaca T-27]